MELIAGVQPLLFFQQESNSPLSLEKVLQFALPGSVLWLRIAVSTYNILRVDIHNGSSAKFWISGLFYQKIRIIRIHIPAKGFFWSLFNAKIVY